MKAVGTPEVPRLVMAKPAASSSRMWISLDLTSASETSGVAQTSREMRRMGSRSAATAAAARAAEGGGPGRGSGTVSRSGRGAGGSAWARTMAGAPVAATPPAPSAARTDLRGRPFGRSCCMQTTLAAARPAGNLRAEADMRAVAVGLEAVGGDDEVAELGVAEGAGVELGGEVLHALADGAQLEPALGVVLHLLQRLADELDGLGEGAEGGPAGAGAPVSVSRTKFSVKMKRVQAWRKASGVFCWPMP